MREGGWGAVGSGGSGQLPVGADGANRQWDRAAQSTVGKLVVGQLSVISGEAGRWCGEGGPWARGAAVTSLSFH